MIKIKNFPNAYKEAYVILNCMDKRDTRKIPDYFIEMLKDNMNTEYKFEIFDFENFEKQKIMKETKVILAYIFLNYLGTEKQNRYIKQKFKQDILEDEKRKDQNYIDKVFFNKKMINTEKIKKDTQSDKIVVYNRKNIFAKIKNLLLNLILKKDNNNE